MRLVLSAMGLSLALAAFGAGHAAAADSSQLHDDLRLSADQEGAWRAYEATMAQSGDAQMRRQATAEMLPRLPTPRRLALIDAAMTQDLADFRRQSQAVTAFYGRLSPEQQRIFDTETQPPQGEEGSSGSRPFLRSPPP